jgi:uncharacterized membrane protein
MVISTADAMVSTYPIAAVAAISSVAAAIVTVLGTIADLCSTGGVKAVVVGKPAIKVPGPVAGVAAITWCAVIGIGTAIIIAIARGCPVILVNRCAVRDIDITGGIVVRGCVRVNKGRGVGHSPSSIVTAVVATVIVTIGCTGT